MTPAPAPPPRRVLVARCDVCSREHRVRPFEGLVCCPGAELLPVLVITLPEPAATVAA